MRVTQISFFNLRHASLESNKKPLQSKYPCIAGEFNTQIEEVSIITEELKTFPEAKEHFNSETCSKADPKDYTDMFFCLL